MLAELGNLPVFVTAHEQRENIEVVVQTVERLSEVRIGALIAIEQTINLLEAVESGVAVAVDCAASGVANKRSKLINNQLFDFIVFSPS